VNGSMAEPKRGIDYPYPPLFTPIFSTPHLIHTMPSLLRCVQRLLIVFFATVLLAACGDDGDSAAPAGGRANTQKYNAYVKASNLYTQQLSFRRPTFADQHAGLTRVVDGRRDFQESAFEWSNEAESQLRTNLEAALALKGKQPGLDGAAQALLAVLKKMEPLSKDLAYYGETKGSLADGGAKVKTLAPQLLPLLEEAHHAMVAFDDALEAADQALLRRNMEEAKDGSLEKYRITTVYYGKRIMGQFHAAHADVMTRQAAPPAPELLEQLREDLQAFDANTQAYLTYITKNKSDKQWQCQDKKRHMVNFLSDARDLLKNFQKDSWFQQVRWDRGRRTTHYAADPDWDRSMQKNFDGIIRGYNRGDDDC